MKLDTIRTADNGQERISLSPQTVYNKVGDNTDVDDCGNEPKSDVNVSVTTNVGNEQNDLKKELLSVIMRLLALL